MTEYLILSLSRAVPLVWDYGKEIIFDVTFARSFGDIQKSAFKRMYDATTVGPTLDSTSKKVLRIFGTPPEPSLPSGVKALAKPRLYRAVFCLGGWTGNPQFRIDLHLANPDYTPGPLLASFTPSVQVYSSSIRNVYIDFGDPPAAFTNGFELDWNTLYALVLVPTLADSSNRCFAYYRTTPQSGSDTLTVAKWGYYNGSSWAFYDGDLSSRLFSSTTVAYAFYYTAEDVTVPVTKSSDAFRSYFNGWTSRTTLPAGFTVLQESINGVTDLTAGTEVPLSDAYTHSMTFYTTADVQAFTQSDVASIKWAYDVNPITIDRFYASEAYLQKIEFLDTTTTNAVRLNDSYEQEFSGSGGTALTFDPPVLWWKAEVLSGRVRLTALVFE